MDKLKKILSRQLKSAKETIEEFSAKLIENPSHALKWSADAFTAGARVDVFTSVLAAIDNDCNFENLVSHVERQTLHGALYPERSTSPYSNELSRETLAAWAKMLETLRDQRVRSMSQLSLFDVPQGAQPGDKFSLAHHGTWTVQRRQRDGKIVLRGKHGFQIVTDADLSARFEKLP